MAMIAVFLRGAAGLAALCLAVALPAAEFSLAPPGPAPAATPATTPAATNKPSFFTDRVVAKGRGFEVTQNQVEEAYIAYRATSAGQGRHLPEDQRPAAERQIMERLVHVHLLSQIANEEDKAKAQEAMDKNLAAYRDQMSSEASFNRQLVALGMTVEGFKAKMYEEALTLQVIDRSLRPGVSVTEDQVKRYYETNAAQFTQPEKMRISHILFLTQNSFRQDLTETQKQEKVRIAEKVLARIKAGEDFAGLAREYSEDPNSRAKGGELPPLARSQMAPEFEKAATALAPGQISEIVATRVGFHILKMHEKVAARVTPLAETRADIREFLVRQEIQQHIPEFLKKLREDAGVEFKEEK